MNNKQINKTISCFDVANYFLVLVDREAGDTITQLKLQKLIYFAQGIHLALFNKPFFEEEIEAWKHGPVAPKLRIPFGNLQDGPIAAPGEMDFDIYTQQQKNLIYKIYSIYGEHTAGYLRNLTHQHSIWLEAIGNIDHTMTKEKIQEFFKVNIINNIRDYILLINKEDLEQIENAEDQWWMNYDSGVPAEDITEQLLKAKQKQEGKNFESCLV
ncbi:Panacea domain-containing protein [Rickettsia endosymbiont of Pantilius tunicatus]|uniref:Panacea domain-containing protein n=1 Tax=Rickettsia endosymbiont of Pantilius tunicatus TaxID=3066267 RepID=UPI0030E5DF43